MSPLACILNDYSFVFNFAVFRQSVVVFRTLFRGYRHMPPKLTEDDPVSRVVGVTRIKFDNSQFLAFNEYHMYEVLLFHERYCRREEEEMQRS